MKVRSLFATPLTHTHSHMHAFESVVESGHDYGLHTVITNRKCGPTTHVPFDVGGH